MKYDILEGSKVSGSRKTRQMIADSISYEDRKDPKTTERRNKQDETPRREHINESREKYPRDGSE